MKKILIGGFLLIIFSVCGFFGSKYIQKINENKIPNKLLVSIQNDLKTKSDAELLKSKTKLEKEYKDKLAEIDKANNPSGEQDTYTSVGYYNLISKYYTQDAASNNLSESMINEKGESNYNLKFNLENTVVVTDGFEHIYSIDHKVKKVSGEESQKININLTLSENEKFDINKASLLKEYIQEVTCLYLSEKDLSLLNVVASGDLDKFSSVKEVEEYIANGEKIKIGDFLIDMKPVTLENKQVIKIEMLKGTAFTFDLN